MALSWNEIKSRAVEFSNEWKDEFNEHAEAKSFMDAFFNVFGIPRRRVATFEQAIKKEDGHHGFIDLLWKGTILIEFKSRGKDLDKARIQAKDYFPGIKDSDLPKYILVCDFERFRLYDLEENTTVEFALAALVNNVQHFGYLLGYQKKVYKEQDPANIKAAELMGKLHDRLEEIGYTGHALEVYLVRLLFCLFAEDTTIFERRQFQEFIEQRTAEDGSDLAAKLQELFQVLNTPKEGRFQNLDEQLAAFAYVNGSLFEEILPVASFDSKMRQQLLDCCYLDWSKISPAIFGSMFQSVMDPQERRNLGAHYTSETNILKLIKPLFLDDLWTEFESIKDNRNKLREFHQRLGKLKFLDPACGCGNFLVITYRELRLLEIEVLRTLKNKGEQFLNVGDIIWLNVDQFYGIELEEFPARIAEVAMWLIDHQMNMQVSNEFGQYFVRLPLKKSAHIVHGNALQLDWAEVVDSSSPKVTNVIASGETRRADAPDDPVAESDEQPASGSTPSGSETGSTSGVGFHPTLLSSSLSGTRSELSYILGNPPFVGKKEQKAEQKADMERLFADVKGSGVLDYVTAWYIKATKYIQDTKIKVAFVSTNSISQGEQVGILWSLLFRFGIKIHFAHRTFKWSNAAKGKAAVHVVIVGFANFDTPNKRIFEYEDIKGEPHEVKARNINPYLTEGQDISVENRKSPICNVPEMNYGSMPIDDGHLILSNDDREEAIKNEPNITNEIWKYTGGDEFINSKKRWCLWLQNVQPSVIRNSKFISERVAKTKEFRLASKREITNKLAKTPMLFGEIRQPNSDYLIVPKVSSENRRYIPIGILDPSVITSGSALIISNADLYLFGIMTSAMHMTWTKFVCGRMKSDYQYSASIVYNNFPWPLRKDEGGVMTDEAKTKIETAAQKVLDTRAQFPDSSLADLYDPLTMPPALVKAHNELDKAVDLAYRSQPFTSEANRMVFLFELYEKYTAGLFAEKKKKKK